MRTHVDERRRFTALTEFPTAGDVNVVELRPNIPIAWHRHQHQTDYLYVVLGTVKVALIHPDGTEEVHTLFPGDTVLDIPPNTYHGYEAIKRAAIVVSYITQHYDPSDEERMSLEEHPWP